MLTIFISYLWILINLHVIYGKGKQLFVFDHLAKTGGTETEKCLHIAFNKDQMIFHSDRFDNGNRGDILKSMLRNNSFITDMVKKGNVNNDWLVIKELDGVSQLEARKESFLIGGIREPCSLYVSMWAYRSNVYESYKNRNTTMNWGIAEQYFGRDKGYGTIEDLKRFEMWMETIALQNPNPLFKSLKREALNEDGGGGLMTSYFRLSYFTPNQEFNIHDIDCWVREENLYDDLKQCFERYMMQGGVIPYYHKYLQYVSESTEIHHANPSSHRECSFYYKNKTIAKQIKHVDASIYNLFDMKGCCKPHYENPTSSTGTMV